MNYTQPAIITSDPLISKNLYTSMIMNNSSNINMTVSNMKKAEPKLCDTVKLIEHLTEDDNNNNSTQLVDKAKKQRYREHQRRQRASLQYRNAHAARERQRVAEFNKAFKKLHSLLPTTVNTTTNNNNNSNNNQSGRRLSKLQILRLCSSYICYLTWILYGDYCSYSNV
ncbi:unnamed protein product [Trichobilharzia szidati]|nr:unnamed protein product [Trichobilharzia szidati]